MRDCRLISVLSLLLCSGLFADMRPTTSPTTGRLHLTFTERSPLSPLDELCKREPFKTTKYVSYKQSSEEEATKWRQQNEYDLSGESFELFVPPGYKQETPCGLLVWISPGAADPPGAWLDALTRHKLIWISANNTGNSRTGLIRAALALDAAYNAKKLYTLDENRIYIAGFSGGGEKASWLLTGFPELFRGGLCIMGYRFYAGHLNPTGRWEFGVDGPKWEGPLDQIKKNTRIVIMSGTSDPQTFPGGDRSNYDAFILDGFAHVSLLEMPTGHAAPNAAWFEKGILALDDPRPKQPPATAPTTHPNPLPGQIAQAKRILTTAEGLLQINRKYPGRSGQMARMYLQEVLDEYPTTPAATRAKELLNQWN